MTLVKKCDICGASFKQSSNDAEINAMGFFHRSWDAHLQNSIVIETYDICHECEDAIREVIFCRRDEKISEKIARGSSDSGQ